MAQHTLVCRESSREIAVEPLIAVLGMTSALGIFLATGGDSYAFRTVQTMLAATAYEAIRAYVVEMTKATIGLCESDYRKNYPELFDTACSRPEISADD